MDNNIKIFITGAKYINKQALAEIIVSINDELEIGNHFTSDENYKGKENKDCIQFIESEDIYLSYKNNSLLYIKTVENISSGIIIDEFYNKDIFVMDIDEFNMIPESLFGNHNTIIIWLDSKYKNNNNIDQDLFETKFLLEKLQYTKYMYFLDEDYNNVAEIVLSYINGDESTKKKLLEENF